jgi:hypothetical protein
MPQEGHPMKPLSFAKIDSSRTHDAVQILRELKPMIGSPAHRAKIQNALDLLEHDLRLCPVGDLEEWRSTYAPAWSGKKKHEEFFRLCLANGRVHKDEIARIIGTPEDPANDSAVRAFVSRLRKSLDGVEATLIIEDAGRDGYYSTQAKPTICTVNIGSEAMPSKVLQFRHR